jgi:hypothetical protein
MQLKHGAEQYRLESGGENRIRWWRLDLVKVSSRSMAGTGQVDIFSRFMSGAGHSFDSVEVLGGTYYLVEQKF